MMHFHRPKLSHSEARRVLWCIFAAAVTAETAIAVHAASLHDVVTSGLVVSAWTREYIIGVIEHIGETLA